MPFTSTKNAYNASGRPASNIVQLDCNKLRFHLDDTSVDRTLFLIAKENINVTLAAWEDYQRIGVAFVTSIMGEFDSMKLFDRTVVIGTEAFTSRYGHQGTCFAEFRHNLGLPVIQ